MLTFGKFGINLGVCDALWDCGSAVCVLFSGIMMVKEGLGKSGPCRREILMLKFNSITEV